MSYPPVRDLAAEGFPVRLTCGVLDHSGQADYAWLAHRVGRCELDDAYLTNALVDAPEFGYRFLADELGRAGPSSGNGKSRGCAHSRSCGPRPCARAGAAVHWRTHEELHEAIVFWTEHTYNRRRRQRALGKLPPVEYPPAPPRPQPWRHDHHPVSTDPAAVPPLMAGERVGETFRMVAPAPVAAERRRQPALDHRGGSPCLVWQRRSRWPSAVLTPPG